MDFFEDLEKKGKKDGIMKRIAGGIISNENNEILFLKRNGIFSCFLFNSHNSDNSAIILLLYT